jgi:hypothetical protein
MTTTTSPTQAAWTHTLDPNTGALAFYKDGVVWGRVVGSTSTRFITRREAAAWLFRIVGDILTGAVCIASQDCTSLLQMMSRAAADLASAPH